MYAVLLFQLAVGMNWPVAQAAPVPQHDQSGGMQMAHCPEHDSSHPPQPLAKHACCRAAGCQCHCAFTLGVTGPTGLRIVVSSGYLLPALEARVSTARPDQFFRPPIA
jgi:hypothetical protein